MKRIQLIETGIIAIILILAYRLITSLIDLTVNLLITASGNMPETVFAFLYTPIVAVILYISLIYPLVKYKKRFARWINGKEQEETITSLNLYPGTILHIVIVILCFITIINQLPHTTFILIEIFTPTEDYNGSDVTTMVDDNYIFDAIWGPVITFSFAIIVLIFSKKIASFWYKKNTAEK